MSSRVSILLIPLLFLSCVKEVTVNGLVITKVNVVDVKTGAILEDQDIYIFEDKISDILPHDPLTAFKSKTIDGSGKYAIPGLWDMHHHIFSWDWQKNLNTSMGITGLRNMHGAEMVSEVRKERKDGFFRGFEFLYSGPITDGPGENWPGTVVVSTPDEGRRAVQEQFQKGYDFVKVYNFLDRMTYLAIADECKKLGIDFAGHIPSDVSAIEAMAAGQKSIEHMVPLELAHENPDITKTFNSESSKSLTYGELASTFLKGYDPNKFQRVLDATKNSETWFCPTLICLEKMAYKNDSTLKVDPRLKYVPKEELDYWFGEVTEFGTPEYLQTKEEHLMAEQELHRVTKSALKPMLDNGTRFLAGTDVGNPHVFPGYGVHEELELFVEAGFTELEALQTATLNPAIYAEREDQLGTLEKWKIANILLLDANPLDDIRNTKKIHGLVRRGEYLDRISLDSLKIDYSKEQ